MSKWMNVIEKLVYIAVLVCLPVNILLCQQENSNWFFGIYSGLKFENNQVLLQDYSSMQQPEGSASVSDHLGNLLFYTSGQTVWNACHQIMDNGTDLWSHWSAKQAATIVPKPGSSHLYYLFSNEAPSHYACYNNCAFSYSIIDMQENNGLGKVILKNQLLFENNTESCTVGISSDSCGLWVISQENGVGFKSFLLNSNGIVNSVISTPYPPINFNTNFLSLKMSPNNDKILATDWSGATIFDFDSSTGVVSNPVEFGEHKFYDGEFSNSGNIVYCNSDIDGTFQYNLLASNIQLSETVVSNIQAMGLEKGPDGKIYGINSDGIFHIQYSDNNVNNCGFEIIFNHNQMVYGGTGLVNNINLECFNINRIKSARVCSENLIEFKSNSPFDLIHDNNFYANTNYQLVELFEGTNSMISTQVNCDSSLTQSLKHYFLDPPNDSCNILNFACSKLHNQEYPVNYLYTNNSNPIGYNYYSFPFYCSLSGWYLDEMNSVKYPNVITANNDGINDLFKPVDSEIPFGTTIYFYNRWGDSVGKLTKYSSEIENKNIWNNLTEGVYFYVVKSECENDRQGFVHLIK